MSAVLSTTVLTDLATATDSTNPAFGWLGPLVSSIGAILVAGIGVASLLWRRRLDRKDLEQDRTIEAEIAGQPKVTDGWEEVRAARLEASTYYNLYRTFENLFYTVFSALRHLARSTRDEHPDQQFDQDVIDALAIIPPDTSEPKK